MVMIETAADVEVGTKRPAQDAAARAAVDGGAQQVNKVRIIGATCLL